MAVTYDSTKVITDLSLHTPILTLHKHVNTLAYILLLMCFGRNVTQLICTCRLNILSVVNVPCVCYLTRRSTPNYAEKHFFSSSQSQYSWFRDPVLSSMTTPKLLPANSGAGCVQPQYSMFTCQSRKPAQQL